ncbi:hypothetical protein FOZ62_026374 [Perkinsus olseni]|uniref:Protein arginine methyltransferase 10 n=2 Tax=Perkinsus olseni TaxID=32597 RepID=A0A7J6RWY1_PEROL|nr:hypothetical protein FOZ62_026374 [Perkinsus olseni]
MMNFVAPWLIVTGGVLVTATPEVGTFGYKNDAYSITVGVDDKYRVGVSFGAFDRCTPDSPKGPPPFCGEDTSFTPWTPEGVRPFSHAFTTFWFSLMEVTNITYTINLPVRHWYKDVGTCLALAGQVMPDDRYPPAGIEAGDMTTLTYTSGDTFTTSFRGEKIEFMREAHNFAAGSFEYVEPVAPHLKLSYWILRYDSVGIEVTCNGRSTGRRHFKLVRRDKGVRYVRYDVEPVGRGTLDDLKRMVRSVCPTKSWQHVDLSYVVFATENTIYVAVEGGRIALTRV